MKKVLIALLFAGIMCPAVTFAGGIVTNANLSAAYIRMPAQDATLGIDAVYYNPAGVAFLKDGFYVSINNQYIVQNRDIISYFPNMNQWDFKGGVVAPVFPTVFFVFKKDKIAYSFGIMPIGGGGSALFEKGLPSFEKQVAIMPGSLTASGIPTSAYSMESRFEGSSIIWGVQVNGSYQLNDMVSVSLGVRYLIAENSYVGYLRNIQIDPNQPAFGAQYDGSSMVSAPQFFTDAATTLSGWSTGATQYAAGLAPIVTAGGGATLLANGTTVGLTAAQVTQIQGLLGAAGQTPAAIGAMTITQARTVLTGAAPVFTAKSAAMTAQAAATSDKQVDAKQSGVGVSPILGLNLKLSDELNIGIRYEHRAKMSVQNDTKIDDVKMFPNAAKTPNDMPSTLSVGLALKATEKISISGGVHYYFDKTANYGKKNFKGLFYKDNSKVVNYNFWEAALGVEYTINDKFLVSAGYLRTKSGVNEYFQSDLSHSLSTNTFGFGLKYNVSDKIAINAGFMKSYYEEYSSPINYQEKYNRNATVAAIGVDFKL